MQFVPTQLLGVGFDCELTAHESLSCKDSLYAWNEIDVST